MEERTLKNFYKISKLSVPGRKAIKYMWGKFCDYHEGGAESDERFERLTMYPLCLDNLRAVCCVASQNVQSLKDFGFDDDQIIVLKEFYKHWTETTDKTELAFDAAEITTCIFQVE